MKTYTVIGHWKGQGRREFKPYKREAMARSLAKTLQLNRLVDAVEILVKEYGEHERAGEYKETVLAIK